ncbi:NDR1/HIN1-like protein 26 [Salvia hispanica]|uniref:NDR1/HIN1-like protein 26 n=1 Tax=Salvia hispanica TaxID=49212 RepID=UPI002009D565|nr:NDR1/HIN1-like protein 26 [Salvia hispanica]
MTLISEKHPKDCASKKKSKKLYLYLTTIVLSLLSVIFIIWLILHPSKPHFSLKEAGINQLNLSLGPSLLNSSIQITLQSHNPNTKVGIYYDDFLLYASYKGQKITPETSVPRFYQDLHETNLLSVSLVGIQLPVSPSFAYEVQRDQGAGRLALSIKGMGQLRWKVWTYVSGRYRFIVNCVVIMPLGPTIPSPPLSARQTSQCSTSM